MPSTALSSPGTRSDLDAVVRRVADAAPTWASMSIRDRAAFAREMLEGIGRNAKRMVDAACSAKRIRPGSSVESEEWLSGPYSQLRLLRQTVASLTDIASQGTTRAGKVGRTSDGRVKVTLFPTGLADAVAFAGTTGEVHFLPGVSEEAVHDSRARFYRRPEHRGRVCVVLGAGNVSGVPVGDVVTKLFNEGTACILKLSPLNAYLAPILSDAFARLVARGFLAIVEGGPDRAAYLVQHPAVDEIHLTGSDRTHDALVWGPPGPERAQRIARDEPLVSKRFTCELGNCGPLLIVPGSYSASDVDFQATAIVAAFAVNGSFTCATPRVLLTAKGWSGRERLLGALERTLDALPPRHGFYPGSTEDRRELLEGRSGYHEGPAHDDVMPWTLVSGLDADDVRERAFSREFFCPVLCEVPIASADPVEFLDRAVAFANDRLWGTLHAGLVVHPRTSADPTLAAAVEKAIERLEYGTVCVNTWTALAFAMGVMPWGGHPGATHADIQSGIGFVHNTRMLEHVEKGVMRSFFRPPFKPPWFPDHRNQLTVATRLTALERTDSLLELPGVVTAALGG